jgi:hypothetical protein
MKFLISLSLLFCFICKFAFSKEAILIQTTAQFTRDAEKIKHYFEKKYAIPSNLILLQVVAACEKEKRSSLQLCLSKNGLEAKYWNSHFARHSLNVFKQIENRL